MPRILVTNDDGINSAGICALEAALARAGEVYTVAPAREMSAAGHSISVHRGPVDVKQVAQRRWAVEGTPADCVLVAMRHILGFRPDLVVSGINHGDNLATHIYYSGTVSAAAEAALHRIPAIAVSLCVPDGAGGDFSVAASFAAGLAARVLETGLPDGVILNVNVPAECRDGARLTRMGRRFGEEVQVHPEPGAEQHYWIHERPDLAGGAAESDFLTVRGGSISVTPLMLDRTDSRSAEELDRWLREWQPE